MARPRVDRGRVQNRYFRRHARRPSDNVVFIAMLVGVAMSIFLDGRWETTGLVLAVLAIHIEECRRAHLDGYFLGFQDAVNTPQARVPFEEAGQGDEDED